LFGYQRSLSWGCNWLSINSNPSVVEVNQGCRLHVLCDSANLDLFVLNLLAAVKNKFAAAFPTAGATAILLGS